MKKRKSIRFMLFTLVVVLFGWVLLTLFVEQAGPSKQWKFGDPQGEKALIVFDPDPFYNLDEQVCISFGKALAEHKMNVTVASVSKAEQLRTDSFAVRIYCANTYNWRPDWSIASFVERSMERQSNGPVVSVTLGAGSTQTSQAHFNDAIVNAGGKLIASYSLWLWRPNDKSKMEEPNVDVAVAMAHNWGNEIARKLNGSDGQALME